MGKPEGKRSLGRPRHRWEYNIKKDLLKVGCGGMDWTELAQYRDKWRTLVNGGNDPSGSIKCAEFLDYVRNGLLLKKDSAPWSKYASIT